jgi:hypothetical protein
MNRKQTFQQVLFPVILYFILELLIPATFGLWIFFIQGVSHAVKGSWMTGMKLSQGSKVHGSIMRAQLFSDWKFHVGFFRLITPRGFAIFRLITPRGFATQLALFVEIQSIFALGWITSGTCFFACFAFNF